MIDLHNQIINQLILIRSLWKQLKSHRILRISGSISSNMRITCINELRNFLNDFHPQLVLVHAFMWWIRFQEWLYIIVPTTQQWNSIQILNCMLYRHHNYSNFELCLWLCSTDTADAYRKWKSTLPLQKECLWLSRLEVSHRPGGCVWLISAHCMRCCPIDGRWAGMRLAAD